MPGNQIEVGNLFFEEREKSINTDEINHQKLYLGIHSLEFNDFPMRVGALKKNFMKEHSY